MYKVGENAKGVSLKVYTDGTSYVMGLQERIDATLHIRIITANELLRFM